MKFNWNKDNEALVLKLRDEDGLKFQDVADIVGTTLDSVKLKYRRLKYKMNKDEYHHPQEKTEQVKKILKDKSNLSILETHAGWGNMTKVYSSYSKSLISLEIDGDRVSELTKMKLNNHTVVKCDSEREIHRLVYEGKKYDVIDLDPYGFASRYFPHVFKLIDDGFLFLTIPKLGINKVTPLMVEHYRVFWGIDTNNPKEYFNSLQSRMKDFGICHYRSVEPIDHFSVDRVYRIVFRVKKESAFDMVGMKVKGINC